MAIRRGKLGCWIYGRPESEKELLKLMRKEKDLPPDNIPTMEKKIKQFEKKLERAKTTLENTKKNRGS